MITMSRYKTIGIIGTRRRNEESDYIKVLNLFQDIYKPGDRIVSGGCPSGGDRFAEKIAKKSQVPITIHYAAWNKLGKRAGFIRNSDIAEDSDVLIACIANDRIGGAEDTIEKFKKLGKIEVYYI